MPLLSRDTALLYTSQVLQGHGFYRQITSPIYIGDDNMDDFDKATIADLVDKTPAKGHLPSMPTTLDDY